MPSRCPLLNGGAERNPGDLLVQTTWRQHGTGRVLGAPDPIVVQAGLHSCIQNILACVVAEAALEH